MWPLERTTLPASFSEALATRKMQRKCNEFWGFREAMVHADEHAMLCLTHHTDRLWESEGGPPDGRKDALPTMPNKLRSRSNT